MRILWRILLILFLIIIVGCVAIIGYIKLFMPHVGDAPDLKIELTTEMMARGSYLANHNAGCIDCHSIMDLKRFGGPIEEGTSSGGGEIFDHHFGIPGTIISKNITPYGVGQWTDGELFRAITTGVNRDGKALFPLMPYLEFGKADKQDIYAIIAYIRTLKSITNSIPASQYDFPVNIMINLMPAKASFTAIPSRSDIVKYGGYIANFGSCIDCHTPFVKGRPNMAMAYAGGREFLLPTGGVVRSMNITPDDSTGIGKWTKEIFLARFRVYSDTLFNPYPIEPHAFNTVMPWIWFSGMTDEDLADLFEYLHSLKPVTNKVERFSATLQENQH
jgi:mono/diheme cytochrome c family protein